MANTYYIGGIVKEPDGSGYSVYFPDFPNVCSGGQSLEEAIEYGQEGLVLGLRFLVEDRKDIPKPSSLEDCKRVVKETRALDELEYPEDTYFHYFKAPGLDMVSVRINITLPKAVLGLIDENAKSLGMTRSGYIVAACQAYSV